MFKERHKRLRILRRIGASSTVQNYVLMQIITKGNRTTVSKITMSFGTEILGYSIDELNPYSMNTEEDVYDANCRAFQVEKFIRSACEQLKKKGYLKIKGWPEERCILTREVNPRQENPKLDSNSVSAIRDFVEKEVSGK